jgi:N-acetylmuramoyl-L-alanine amidase
MPPGSAGLDSGYNEGYAHLSAALQRDPDIFVSLHFNGANDPNVGGTAVYYSPAGGEQNESLATLMTADILAAIRAAGYEPPYALTLDDLTIGKTYGGLATLGNVAASGGNRLFGVPAVLLEPLFETNPTERAVIESDLLHQQIAAAIVRTITIYLGDGAAVVETSVLSSDTTAWHAEMRRRSRLRSPRLVVSTSAR